jgi:hypothetical protein
VSFIKETTYCGHLQVEGVLTNALGRVRGGAGEDCCAFWMTVESSLHGVISVGTGAVCAGRW